MSTGGVSSSSGLSASSEYDREYRIADRKMLFDVVDHATNAYLTSAETMNLSMSITIDFIDASSNTDAGIPGVEYRAPRINITFDKLKHGKVDPVVQSVATKNASSRTVSTSSTCSSPGSRHAGGASNPNLCLDDLEEFERGAHEDRSPCRKTFPTCDMASRRNVAVRRNLPTGAPFAVVVEAATTGRKTETVPSRSFWNRDVDRSEFQIGHSKLTRREIQKWLQSGAEATQRSGGSVESGVSIDAMAPASVDDALLVEGPWGSVSETDVFENGNTSKRVQCGGAFIKLHKDD
ncbi:hypothetical protein QR680_018267 [Steinernema hermaphroditum]|uniref:Uncharacterized protein n=1 Tax=Steinernema hermaphroditum TaxID=289476 RepID=A0AA39HIP4_9BILA|nr:hypothetical protein QR680_018267 [Steinernema hermaphroditum]